MSGVTNLRHKFAASHYSFINFQCVLHSIHAFFLKTLQCIKSLWYTLTESIAKLKENQDLNV